jgi:hypothetical protein
MHLAGAWMTEKYFAATPYTCHNQFLVSIKTCGRRLRIALWHIEDHVEIKRL